MSTLVDTERKSHKNMCALSMSNCVSNPLQACAMLNENCYCNQSWYKILSVYLLGSFG